MRRHAFVALVCGAFLAGCSGGSLPTPGVPGGGEPPSNAILVEVSLDEGRAAHASIPVTGGVLETTAADGTAYRLSIPEGALLFPADITMTPVESMTGLSFSGGLVAAVHFEPEGLVFAEPAILDVVPVRDVPVERQVPFSYRGDTGEAFYGWPATDVAGDEHTIRLYVTHFSGTGVGDGTQEERRAVADSVPSEPRDQTDADLGKAVDEHRKGEIDSETLVRELERHFRNHHDATVVPAMDQAEQIAPDGDPADQDRISSAVTEYLSWERSLLLLGLEDFMRSEREALERQMLRIVESHFEGAYDRCVVQHDLSVVGHLAAVERQATLLGIELTGTFTDCLSFELVFDSDMAYEQDILGSTSERWNVQATVPLRFTGMELEGSGPLDYLRHEASGTLVLFVGDFACDISPAGTLGSTFTALALSMSFDTPDLGVELIMDPGQPMELLRLSCTDSEPHVQEEQSWLYHWSVNHARESLNENWVDGGPYLIQDWEYESSDADPSIVATKTHVEDGALEDGTPTAVEITTWTLLHAPTATR